MNNCREPVQGFTIDGELSKDLDDAIFLESIGGDTIVHVSISDVASIPELMPNGELDLKAKQLGFTRYFADDNSPMLPRKISENSASLLPGEKRDTITFSIPISKEMQVGEPRIRFTTLTSFCKLSYVEADAIIRNKEHDLHPMLSKCNKLAQLLLNKRRQNGALAVYDLMKGWATTEDGQLIKLTSEQAHLSNIIIQEFMILTNATAAEFFARKGIPIMFRNHTASVIAPQRAALLHDLMNAISDPGAFKIGTLKERLGIVLNKATYNGRLLGHHALNLVAYAHFTSPIRRYADLVNHRLLAAFLRGDDFPYAQEELEGIAEHLNQLALQLKEKKDRYYTSKQLKEARCDLNVNLYSSLSPEEFSERLEKACTEVKLSRSLVVEICKRLKYDQLAGKDIFAMLSLLPPQAKQRKSWKKIYSEVLLWISRFSDKAEGVFYLAQEKMGWPALEYHILEKGPELLQGTAEIRIDEKQVVSHLYSSPVERELKKFLTVDLLAQIFSLTDSGVEFSSPGVREDESFPAPVAIDSLSKGEFQHLLELACAEDNCTQELETSVTRRLMAGQLPVKDMFLILCRASPNDEKWFDIRTKVLHWLIAYPEKAISIMQIATQELNWPAVIYETSSQGLSHCLNFESLAKITIEGKELISKPWHFAVKKTAEQMATLDLLRNILGIQIRIEDYINQNVQQNTAVPIQEKRGENMEDIKANSKGKLLELCTQNKWNSPKFVIEESGPDHMKTFSCQATLTTKEGEYRAKIEGAASKKEAERLASQELLTHIPTIQASPQKLPNPLASNLQDENWINLLQEFCQKNQLSLPSYSPVKSSGPSHTPQIEITCTLERDGEEPLTHTAKALSKKEAKQIAARNVYKMLIEAMRIMV